MQVPSVLDMARREYDRLLRPQVLADLESMQAYLDDNIRHIVDVVEEATRPPDAADVAVQTGSSCF